MTLVLPKHLPRKPQQIVNYRPGNTGAVGTPRGYTLGTGGTGTVTHSTPTAASWARYTIWTAGATAGNANGFRMGHSPFFRQVGWKLTAIATWVPGVSGQLQIGLASGAALGGEPSAVTNQICVGYDSTDANLQLMQNDGTGAALETDLLIPRTAPVVFLLTIDCEPNGNPVISVTNIYTGAVILAPTTLTTKIPAVSQALSFVAHCRNTVTTPPGVGLGDFDAIINP